MRIGILETGFPPEELRETYGSYPEQFAKLLDGHGFEFKAWPVLTDDFPASPADADGWLITGSRFGVYEDHAWIPKLEAFVRQAVAARIPIVGICFGHQLLAQALGGKVINSDRGWGVGPNDYRDLETGKTITIVASHQDQVVEQPPATEIIAESDFCPIAGLRWTDAPVISWQPHPEMSKGFVTDLLKMRYGTTYPKDVADKALARMEDPIDSPAMGDRIARFFQENAAKAEA